MTKEEIKKLRNQVEPIYNGIIKVHCPILKEEVYFNAKGKYHLRYEVTGRERTREEQGHKLRLVKYIEQIVKNATTIEESRLVKAPIGRKKRNGKKIIKDVIYSSIVQTITTASSSKKVKVILRKVGNGRVIFWSVMKVKK